MVKTCSYDDLRLVQGLELRFGEKSVRFGEKAVQFASQHRETAIERGFAENVENDRGFAATSHLSRKSSVYSLHGAAANAFQSSLNG